MSVFRQLVFTCIVCALCLNIGLMYSWPSSTLHLFSSPNTTLDRPMTTTEKAFFGSLSFVAALISTPFAGYLLDHLGRKYTCVLFALPQTIAWTIATSCHTVEAILAAVFISGLGGANFIVAPVFIGEFCQETIRGTVTTAVLVFYSTGMLLSYVLGGSLDYHTANYVCLSISALGLALTVFLKESPTVLMKKGLEKEAAESIGYYRGEKVNSKEVMQEIDNIRRALNVNPESEDAISTDGKLQPPKEIENLSFWQFMKKSKSTQRALFICLILCTSAVFQGLIVVQVYAQPLFAEAVPNVSTTLSSVILGLVVIASGCIAAYLIDKVGRRPLLIHSSIVTGLCCVILGTQIQFHWGPHWVSAILLYTYCVAFSLGAGTVPFVIIVEVFLPEIKGAVTMMAMEWAWICSFTILFIFNPLVTTFGLGPVFYIFSVASFFMAIFCTFCLPETKGLTVDVIQTLFVKNKRPSVP